MRIQTIPWSGVRKTKWFAIDLRARRTAAEGKLKKLLREWGERRRLSLVVGRMIVDLAVPSKNLLIEVDGGYHTQRKERDSRRDLWLTAKGFNVLRITNEDVLERSDAIRDRIALYPSSEENQNNFNRRLRRLRRETRLEEKRLTQQAWETSHG